MYRIRKFISDWLLASWWFIPPSRDPIPEPPKPAPLVTVRHHHSPRRPCGVKRGVYIQR